jgi:hypothetical protein
LDEIILETMNKIKVVFSFLLAYLSFTSFAISLTWVKEERIIRKEDIKEIRERGVSVNIPTRRDKNKIQRIGSNKEIRGGNDEKIFFNKGR